MHCMCCDLFVVDCAAFVYRCLFVVRCLVFVRVFVCDVPLLLLMCRFVSVVCHCLVSVVC